MITNDTLLWRLNDAAEATLTAGDKLKRGLRTHLLHAPLRTTLMQIGLSQQSYVSVAPCTGCVQNRCEAGCPVELLRRLLHATFDGATLTLVKRGLSDRAYTRAFQLWPQVDALPLDGTLLHHWSEAQLSLDWRRVAVTTKPLRARALLLTSADGPDPLPLLRARHWEGAPLPAWLRRLGLDWRKAAWRQSRSWIHTPYLLLPVARSVAVERAPSEEQAGAAEEAPAQEEEDGSEASLIIARQLAAHLEPLLRAVRDAAPKTEAANEGDTTFRTQDSTPDTHATGDDGSLEAVSADTPPETSIWPPGPGRMRSSDVAWLIEQMQTSPIVQSGDEPGVTRKRIAQLLPDDQSEYSRQLMLWLHAADVLAPPPVEEEPFRNPRLLLSDDVTTLATQLAATPLPSVEEARAAMQK